LSQRKVNFQHTLQILPKPFPVTHHLTLQCKNVRKTFLIWISMGYKHITWHYNGKCEKNLVNLSIHGLLKNQEYKGKLWKKNPKLENHKFPMHRKETNNVVQVEKRWRTCTSVPREPTNQNTKYKVLKFFFCVMWNNE
jgi:hypothetical protein